MVQIFKHKPKQERKEMEKTGEESIKSSKEEKVDTQPVKRSSSSTTESKSKNMKPK